jgi:hypothetical protein
MMHDESNQLLQVVREPIAAGKEAAYEAIEQEIAHACAELGCPHPHLALEPVSGPREVWWLNLFASEVDRRRVVDEYARNAPLMAVLERNGKRKGEMTGPIVDLLCSYRPDLSRGVRLELAGARFLLAIINPGAAAVGGAVFEAGDGTLLLLRPAAARQDAERLAAGSSAGSTIVLAVRPSWGLPATEWIDADRDFWRTNPVLQP